MTILNPTQRGLAQAAAHLENGDAICVPESSPLPYAVVARLPETVNRAKRRSSEQPVGVAIGSIEEVTDFVDLDRNGIALASWLSADQGFSLMVPVRSTVPHWALGATREGRMAITLAWLPSLRNLLERYHHLYLSSANVTGGAVAVTAAEADDAFDGKMLVIDGDRYRSGGEPTGSGSILQMNRTGHLSLVREGIQHKRFREGGNQALLRSLAKAWAYNDGSDKN